MNLARLFATSSKHLLRLRGAGNPFITKINIKKEKSDVSGKETESSAQEAEFCGVVTFEVSFKEIVGMEFTNMLVKYSSRVVFEAKTIKKLSFENINDFFQYYKIDEDIKNVNKKAYYKPFGSECGQKLKVRQVFPFEE